MIVITAIDALPDYCYKCPCHNGESGYCQADKERRYSDYRPYWCPLAEQEIGEVVKPRFKKLKVPEKCGECRSCSAAITSSPYCRMEARSSSNPQMDISSIYVNIDSRPVWCPIIRMNNELDRMPFEKRAELEKLRTALSPWFGGEDLWE